MAVFFPSAEYQVTTRISQVGARRSRPRGKVLNRPGWPSIYGKEAANEVEDGKAGDKGLAPAPVKPGEMTHTEARRLKGLKTKPPRAYPKPRCWRCHGERRQADRRRGTARSAMQEKGLGTPGHARRHHRRPADRKYMLREGRELIPTAKAFQLMTLLRGLRSTSCAAPSSPASGNTSSRRWSAASSRARPLCSRSRP